MLRRLLIVLLAVAGPTLIGLPASAATVVDRVVTRDVVEVVTEPLTCEEGSPLYVFTTVSDVRFHMLAGEGRDQFTFHRVGTFTAEPVDDTAGLPTYTGRFVQRATGQRTLDNPTVVETGSASQSVHGIGSDGTRLRYGSLGHLTFVLTRDGTVREVEFEKCRA